MMFDLVPFRKGRHLRNLMPDNFFDDFFDMGFFSPAMQLGRGMRVDIKETDDRYLIEADLPGFNKEDIDVELKDNRLTISAVHDEDTEEKSDDYIRRERRSGRLVRSFTLDNVKHEEISAKYESGVLRLELPKEKHTPDRRRRIDIQ